MDKDTANFLQFIASLVVIVLGIFFIIAQMKLFHIANTLSQILAQLQADAKARSTPIPKEGS